MVWGKGTTGSCINRQILLRLLAGMKEEKLVFASLNGMIKKIALPEIIADMLILFLSAEHQVI